MNAADRYDSLFQFYGRERWELLKRQARAESNFVSDARSPVGALGLAQFMPATWKDWGVGGDPFNPEHSIRAQANYMEWLLWKFQGDVRLALAAYNWGPGHVAKNPDPAKWPAETRGYVERILAG